MNVHVLWSSNETEIRFLNKKSKFEFLSMKVTMKEAYGETVNHLTRTLGTRADLNEIGSSTLKH